MVADWFRFAKALFLVARMERSDIRGELATWQRCPRISQALNAGYKVLP